MQTNSLIREAARQELKGNWTQPVLATLVYCIIATVVGCLSSFDSGKLSLIGGIVTVLILVPIGYAFAISFLQFFRQDKENMTGKLFNNFRNGTAYGRSLGVSLLTALFIILWTLLFVIPGIIKSYAYAMTIFISYDHPELSADDCIERSKAMMQGKKWKLFLLDLSFIGWILLGILTLCIGYLWLAPYMEVSRVKFYEELKAEFESGEQSNPTAVEA